MAINQQGWELFLDLCASTNSKDQMQDLFSLLFTAEERENFSLRCLIIKELLAQQQTQRQIAENFHVSIAKITRGSNELKRISPLLLEFLKAQLLF